MGNTNDAFRLPDALRAMSSVLETPVIVLLILIVIGTVMLLGWLAAEFLTERRRLKVKLPALLDELRKGSDLPETISGSGLLKRQKEALIELLRHPDFNNTMREALAIRLIEQEQARYDKIVKLSEIIMRIGPMCGLLGTLIPLGPGIIALGQGDTYTLSVSMLTAFDTTIAGLGAAAIATVITTVRKIWYKDYMSMLEALEGCLLEVVGDGEVKR